MLPTVDLDKRGNDEWVVVAGLPVAQAALARAGRHGLRDHRRLDGRLQVIVVWRELFAGRRRELGSQVVEFTGRVSNLD